MTRSSTPRRAMRFCSPRHHSGLWNNANLGATWRLQLWKRRKKKKENKLLLKTVPPHFCRFIFIIRSCLFPSPRHHALEVSHRSDLLVLSHPSSSLAGVPYRRLNSSSARAQIAQICQWLHCLLNKLIVSWRLKKEPQTFMDVPVLMLRPFMLFYQHLLWIKTCVRVVSPLIPLPSLFHQGT